MASLPSRGALWAGVALLGFANGIVARIGAAMADDPMAALLGTFDISVLVWAAFLLCITTMLEEKAPLGRADLLAGGLALPAFLLPVDWLSWIALTGLGLHLLWRERPDAQGVPPPLRRAGWILLATAGAMFWGRVVLVVASDPILHADAAVASWLVGAPRLGNTLPFADGSGYVWIAASCSSLANVSLAILCWVLFAQHRGLRWTARGLAWCGLAIAAVVAINAARIGLIVLYPAHFDLLHGQTGAMAAGWLTVLATVAICAWGTRPGAARQGGVAHAPHPAPR